jgi:hypothetical protein
MPQWLHLQDNNMTQAAVVETPAVLGLHEA